MEMYTLYTPRAILRTFIGLGKSFIHLFVLGLHIQKSSILYISLKPLYAFFRRKGYRTILTIEVLPVCKQPFSSVRPYVR